MRYGMAIAGSLLMKSQTLRLFAVAGILLSACEADVPSSTLPPAPPPAVTQEPETQGPIGQRAFDDLAAYYKDKSKQPDVRAAIKDLRSPDEATRSDAGRYLLALLSQMFADEGNGRAEWIDTGFWGGSAESVSREFRKTVALALANDATGEESIDAALWLLEYEKVAANQVAGFKALKRIQGPRVAGVLKSLLTQPHPNGKVASSAVKEVGRRGLTELAPDVKRLTTHYRTTVRDAARTAATALGIKDLPKFVPEKAFTPFLEKALESMAAMVFTKIPGDARWRRFTITHPYQDEFSGWHIAKNKVIDQHGRERTLEEERFETFDRTLQDDAEALLKMREDSKDDSSFSSGGGMTGQFEPRFVSVPEILVAVWSATRGDRKTAARVLFPRIDAAADDRWIEWTARNLLGHLYHQQMLDVFSYGRDYEEATRLADHLSQGIFDDYQYQDRAKELSAQLKRRGEDFKKLLLPTAKEWARLRTSMDRPGQVKYLAKRLRILNCFQTIQPGDVDYTDPQYPKAMTAYGWDDDPQTLPTVINPYVELDHSP